MCSRFCPITHNVFQRLRDCSFVCFLPSTFDVFDVLLELFSSDFVETERVFDNAVTERLVLG